MERFNDEPVLADVLGRMRLVAQVANEAAQCKAPQVIGVHGEWGAGKTSFLWQVHWFLTGECPQFGPIRDDLAATLKQHWRGQNLQATAHVRVVWFEAWRYQRERAPIVALLHEIREQLAWQIKLSEQAKKTGGIVVRSALFAAESITKLIGVSAEKVQDIGEKWESDHLAVKLPSHMIREHLEDAIGKLIGRVNKDSKERVVILIDDLDRCEPRAAYQLLEGIKIYLNLPSCVFVLGMNHSVIESAIANQLPKSEDAQRREQLAREYLEKICQKIHVLPRNFDPGALLARHLPDEAPYPDLAKLSSQALPRNPRRIKAFADVLRRFVEHTQNYPDAVWDGARKPSMLMLMANLYCFHPELYVHLDHEPRFIEEIQRWSQTQTEADHEDLRAIRLPEKRIEDKSKVAGPSSTPQITPKLTYPDPTEGGVFRVQYLMDWLDQPANEGPITPTEVKRYLLRYDVEIPAAV